MAFSEPDIMAISWQRLKGKMVLNQRASPLKVFPLKVKNCIVYIFNEMCSAYLDFNPIRITFGDTEIGVQVSGIDRIDGLAAKLACAKRNRIRHQSSLPAL